MKKKHGDFKISWEAFTPTWTIKGQEIEEGNGLIFSYMGDLIPSGEVNFSAMERNNETLQEVMSYVRIILTISIGGILLRQYYLVILAILGVNIAIYGQETEQKNTLKRTSEKEKNQQAKQEQAWRDKLEKQRYNEWLRSHRK